jgi:ABC-type Fe3+ transport system permease subunit
MSQWQKVPSTAARKSKVKSQKSKVKSQKSKVKSQKSKAKRLIFWAFAPFGMVCLFAPCCTSIFDSYTAQRQRFMLNRLRLLSQVMLVVGLTVMVFFFGKKGRYSGKRQR